MKYITIVLTLLLIASCAHVSTTPLKDEKEKLLGSWNGRLETPGGSLTVVYRFEMTEGGKFVGFGDSPDQGAFDIPVTDTEIENGTVTIKVSSLQAEYKGKMAGDEIVGEFTQMGRSLPLTLKKGKYKAPVYSLNLSKETMEQLAGEWQGKLGPLTLVFRFEKTENRDFVGFVDSPNQGAKGIPITGAALTDGRLELKIAGVGGEFSGQLSGNSLAGEWTQMGQSNSLTLKKK